MTEDLKERLTLASLRAMAAVAEFGSVRTAARVLTITPPAVSYQISQLSAALGTPLFERTRDGMVPTPVGERLARAARTVERELDRVEMDIQSMQAGGEGLLRISSVCFTAYHWLAFVLKRFREEYPDVHVEVDVDASRRPLEAVARGELDVVLTTEPPTGPGVRVTPLFDDEIVAVMPPDHPLASRKYLTPRHFANESVLVFSEEVSDLFNLVLRPAGVRPRYVAEVRVTEAIVAMVKAGVGISALASWIVKPELESGELVAVRVTRRGIRRSWSGVTRAKGPAPAYIDHFLAILADNLKVPHVNAGRRFTAAGRR